MKKSLLVLVMMLFVIIAVTGCGKEKVAADRILKCQLESGDILETYFITYRDNKMYQAEYSIGTKYSSDNEAKKANEKDAKDVESIKNMKGVEVVTSLNGNSTVNSIIFDIEDLDDTSKAFFEEAYSPLNDKSYDEARSILENGSYKCE